LEFLARLAVGSECDRRFNELWDQARLAAHESRPGAARLRAVQNKFSEVPVHRRRDFLDSDDAARLHQAAEQAVREMRNAPRFVKEARRVFTLSAPRPKGVSHRICKEVAEEFAKVWSCPELGSRYALRCWVEYRRFVKETQVPTD
jgi:hypothetical protein